MWDTALRITPCPASPSTPSNTMKRQEKENRHLHGTGGWVGGWHRRGDGSRSVILSLQPQPQQAEEVTDAQRPRLGPTAALGTSPTEAPHYSLSARQSFSVRFGSRGPQRAGNGQYHGCTALRNMQPQRPACSSRTARCAGVGEGCVYASCSVMTHRHDLHEA